MQDVQFSGIYRVKGDSKLKAQLKAARITLKEPFKAAAIDGNDVVLLTQKDAADFLKQDYGVETPAKMLAWGLKDWLNPKNYKQIKAFAQDAKKQLDGKDIKGVMAKVVDYYNDKKATTGKDAYGNAIQEVDA